MVESNELIKNNFNINKDRIPLEEQRNMFNELVEERSSEFMNLEKRINPDNLIYIYKAEGISPKDFRNYWDSIRLFKDLRDGNISPKKVLKHQINFKSDLGGIKKEIRNENQRTK